MVDPTAARRVADRPTAEVVAIESVRARRAALATATVIDRGHHIAARRLHTAVAAAHPATIVAARQEAITSAADRHTMAVSRIGLAAVDRIRRVSSFFRPYHRYTHPLLTFNYCADHYYPTQEDATEPLSVPHTISLQILSKIRVCCMCSDLAIVWLDAKEDASAGYRVCLRSSPFYSTPRVT